MGKMEKNPLPKCSYNRPGNVFYFLQNVKHSKISRKEWKRHMSLSLPDFQEDLGAFECNDVTKMVIIFCISMFQFEMFAAEISNAIHILFPKINVGFS